MREVALSIVLEVVRAAGPAGPCDERVAEAIHAVANASPILPTEDGAERTATVLAALAAYEGRKDPNAEGDKVDGIPRSFGLYGIMQPVWKWPVRDLKDPLTSSVLAARLVRTSFVLCAHRPWNERLSWYAASSGCKDVHPVILAQSKLRMRLADELWNRFFKGGA